MSISDRADGVRLDLFLWFARIAKTRTIAQEIARGGHLRIDGRRVSHAHIQVRIGDVLSFAQCGRVRALKIEKLPSRRGPAAEAQTLYRELGETIIPTSTAPAAEYR